MKRSEIKRKTPLRRTGSLKRGAPPSRRGRLKGKSEKRKLEDVALGLIQAAWTPKKCARCECPGLGWLSKGGSFDPHHIAGRAGWRLFVFVPLCRTCHDEIHANPEQARADRWLITFKLKRQ